LKLTFFFFWFYREDESSDLLKSSYDVVLCSDCFYEPKAVPFLLKILSILSAQNPNCSFFLTIKYRHLGREKEFIQQLQKSFHTQFLSSKSKQIILSKYEVDISGGGTEWRMEKNEGGKREELVDEKLVQSLDQLELIWCTPL